MKDKDSLIQALLTGNRDVIASLDSDNKLGELFKHLQRTGFYNQPTTSSGALHPKYPLGTV
jgi:hypothetical protein